MSKPAAVIFDIDGTLCSSQERQHLIHSDMGEADWDKFHLAGAQATPNLDLVETLHTFRKLNYRIVIFTGRPSKHQHLTEMWFLDHSIPHDELRMRPNTDHNTSNAELKRIFLKDLRRKNDVVMAFDDMPAALTMYREEGVPCLKIQM